MKKISLLLISFFALCYSRALAAYEDSATQLNVDQKNESIIWYAIWVLCIALLLFMAFLFRKEIVKAFRAYKAPNRENDLQEPDEYVHKSPSYRSGTGKKKKISLPGVWNKKPKDDDLIEYFRNSNKKIKSIHARVLGSPQFIKVPNTNHSGNWYATIEYWF